MTAGFGRERTRQEPEAGPGAPTQPQSNSGPDPGDHPRQHGQCLEWCPICRGAEILRAGGAPELRGQLQSAQRDSLMMLRALIDSYLQRASTGADGPADSGKRVPPA